MTTYLALMWGSLSHKEKYATNGDTVAERAAFEDYYKSLEDKMLPTKKIKKARRARARARAETNLAN